MYRFFVGDSDIDYDLQKVTIVGDDVKHISKVLRCRLGDVLEISNSNNREFLCSIEEITKNEVVLNIDEEVIINRESDVKVILYQGLPKNTKMEIILQKLTECGVSEIVLVDTERSVVNFDDKKSDKKFERWERIIYEAAKQSKRGILPKLRGILSFEEALEDMKSNSFNISPYENEDGKGIKEVVYSLKDDIKNNDDNEIRFGIFVGPEGGFTPEENDEVKNNGIHSVSMGPRIFRTETASIVTTSIVLYELGDIGI